MTWVHLWNWTEVIIKSIITTGTINKNNVITITDNCVVL